MNAQCQQRNEDADGFLLEPAEHEGKGQVVHAALEGIGQRQRDLNGAVGVVALAYIEDAGQPRHRAKVEIVQPELAARQCQEDGIANSV